jgi:hypothetical protein
MRNTASASAIGHAIDTELDRSGPVAMKVLAR